MLSSKLTHFLILLSFAPPILGAFIKARLNCTVPERSAKAWYKIYKLSNESNGRPAHDGIVYDSSGGTGKMFDPTDHKNPTFIDTNSADWHMEDAEKYFLVMEHKCCAGVLDWDKGGIQDQVKYCLTRTGQPRAYDNVYDFGDVELIDNCKPPAVCPTSMT